MLVFEITISLTSIRACSCGGIPSEMALMSVSIGGSLAVIDPNFSSLSFAMVISSCIRETTVDGFDMTELGRSGMVS